MVWRRAAGTGTSGGETAPFRRWDGSYRCGLLTRSHSATARPGTPRFGRSDTLAFDGARSRSATASRCGSCMLKNVHEAKNARTLGRRRDPTGEFSFHRNHVDLGVAQEQ